MFKSTFSSSLDTKKNFFKKEADIFKQKYRFFREKNSFFLPFKLFQNIPFSHRILFSNLSSSLFNLWSRKFAEVKKLKSLLKCSYIEEEQHVY